ncbi:MAG: sulfatase family protein [Planctomycetota bacterium]|jgi:arylsulfatase A-like enzyme
MPEKKKRTETTDARRRNVILFQTDQQRADSLGCMGGRYALTPSVDAMARCGVLYTNHYASNPVCMPSRASLFTGRHVQAHRLLDNGIFLPESELTMAEAFRRSGYRTEAVGKLHFQTFKTYPGDTSMESMGRWNSGELDGWEGPYYGFERVQITVAHGEGTTGHYGRWRARNFPDLKLGPDNAEGEKFPKFNSWKSNLPLEAYHSTWVADRAVEFLEGAGEGPFFLYVSFPDPHSPFTPPAPYSGMYDGVQFEAPHAVEGENETKPKPYREAMVGHPFPTDGGLHHFPDFTGAAYNQVVAHTHGMVALIDDCVGRVLVKLDQLGLSNDTIVAFTSDHGDCLGDHFFLYKAQTPCRSLLHIPLVICDPGGPRGVVDGVCGNVDVMPTLLSLCGIEIPDVVQGEVLPAPGEKPARDYAFESGWSKASSDYHHFTIYTDDHRISYFPYLADGELYDLKKDPFEHRNLYNDPEYRDLRGRLMERLLAAVGKAEPKMPAILTDW